MVIFICQSHPQSSLSSSMIAIETASGCPHQHGDSAQMKRKQNRLNLFVAEKFSFKSFLAITSSHQSQWFVIPQEKSKRKL